MSDQPRIAVVGAGILGTVLALRLAEAGADVTVLERAPSAGGLAGLMDFGGHRVDRFYHVIVPSDERMIALAEELGLSDDLSFSPGRRRLLRGRSDVPVQRDRRLPALPAAVAARARASGVVRRPVPAAPRLRAAREHCRCWTGSRVTAGRQVVERIWQPLLNSRFDSSYDELPATYLWARTNRMRSARKGGGSEMMGCLKGGHERLVDAVASRARSSGRRRPLRRGRRGSVRSIRSWGDRRARRRRSMSRLT